MKRYLEKTEDTKKNLATAQETKVFLGICKFHFTWMDQTFNLIVKNVTIHSSIQLTFDVEYTAF